jgi:hypothetical protein|tara:strand:+ start:119 stop:373 length:255 start_codon:yes stop_codon:yes gene_type:complete
MDDMNDFGFTAVDQDELQAVQEAMSAISEVSASAQARLDKLYNAILPLLANLKANPEREYILWPSRTAKIEEFEKKLLDIYEGK